MLWFHRHEFDPDKWVLIEHYNLYSRLSRSSDPYASVRLFSNTCKTCGDLVFNEVKSPAISPLIGLPKTGSRTSRKSPIWFSARC